MTVRGSWGRQRLTPGFLYWGCGFAVTGGELLKLRFQCRQILINLFLKQTELATVEAFATTTIAMTLKQCDLVNQLLFTDPVVFYRLIIPLDGVIVLFDPIIVSLNVFMILLDGTITLTDLRVQFVNPLAQLRR